MTRARDVANLIGSGNYSSTTFTATAGQTAFTISHTQGFIQVFMNGLLLDETVDYTSNGSAVTLTSGAAAGDEIEVVAYNTFSVGDALPKSGGAMTGALTVDAAASTVLTVDRATSDGTIIDVQKGGTSVGSIGANSGDLMIGTGVTGMRFSDGENSFVPSTITGNSNRDNAIDLGKTSSRFKDLYLSGGAYLGGTGLANYLDDYEFGDFTPALTGYTNVTGTMTGKYVKIGSFVHCHVMMSITGLTYSGNTRITGWPFTPNRTINQHPGQGTIGTGTALNVDPHLYHFGFYSQTGNLYLYNKNSASALTGNNYQVGVLGINVTYQTDD